MSKLIRNLLLASPAMLGIAIAAPVAAQTATDNGDLLNQLENYGQEGRTNSFNQVTNVNQLRDVSPSDWAYEALRGLVERYGCIAGYPNQTYRGNQALTRYEFAAGLNSCLNQLERLIASSEAVVREDLDTINRLTQEFEAELATLGGRIDSLESRTAFLEDNQFSTTTKLEGEVVFGIAQEFNYDNQVVFQDRVRLAFVSSFTGEDALYTRLDASNAGTFDGIDTGALTYQTSDSGNDVT
ncbi:MAG TPA: iron uptake porin, partial [Xenococcaceae cyanobacterium]